MEMGQEIRRLRTNRGITQEALAAALNVSPHAVSKLECGNSVPDIQLLPEIALYFGVTIDQLFAISPEQQMECIGNRIDGHGFHEIRGDRAGAVASYKEVLRLLRDEWGIVSGKACEEIERAIHRIQA